MIKKIIISMILSLITMFSFSIVDRSCSTNLYGIFEVWLMESVGFHDYSFFLYGFLINFFILFILLFLKMQLKNRYIFILLGLYVNFKFKTNIRLHADPRNTVPEIFMEDNIDRKISFFLMNHDLECPD